MKTMKKLLLSIFTLMVSFVVCSFVSKVNGANLALTEKPAIVFDLGGVLFDTDTAVVTGKQIGHSLAIRFALTNFSFSGKAISKRWFSVLEHVARNNNHTFAFHNEDGTPIEVKNEHGTPLPSYMLEWMAGYRSNQELFNEVTQGIKAIDTLSNSDKIFMINLTKVFLPELFVASRKPIVQTIALIKSLKKKGYPLYILSNWDRESFEKMLQKYPEIFSIFDGYIVSGIVQLAKPDIRIYQELESQFPHNCYIFIDDQQSNILAAQKCGWNALKVKASTINKKKLKQSIMALSSTAVTPAIIG